MKLLSLVVQLWKALGSINLCMVTLRGEFPSIATRCIRTVYVRVTGTHYAPTGCVQIVRHLLFQVFDFTVLHSPFSFLIMFTAL